MKMFPKILFFSFLIILYGCAIRQEIVPVDAKVAANIDKVYIMKNFNDRLDPALKLIEQKLDQQSIPNERVNSSQLPEGARFHIEYEGEWNWDMADYLTLFRMSLFKDGRIIGGAEYNAKTGGMRLDKWGSIEDKISPVIDEFLTTMKPR
jgi:hypothetical protein